MNVNPEYIRLCRELQLCDWRGPGGNGWPPDARWIPKGARRPRMVANAGAPFKNEGATWLPREGDWLDLFEQARLPVTLRMMFDGTGSPYWYMVGAQPMGLNTTESDPDCLTALARLYAAVTGLRAS